MTVQVFYLSSGVRVLRVEYPWRKYKVHQVPLTPHSLADLARECADDQGTSERSAKLQAWRDKLLS